jgi:hypothetical protein
MHLAIRKGHCDQLRDQLDIGCRAASLRSVRPFDRILSFSYLGLEAIYCISYVKFCWKPLFGIDR